MNKVQYPLLWGGGEIIKSAGEEYQVVQVGRDHHCCEEEYNMKKGKGEAMSISSDPVKIKAVRKRGRRRKFWGGKSRFKTK